MWQPYHTEVLFLLLLLLLLLHLLRHVTTVTSTTTTTPTSKRPRWLATINEDNSGVTWGARQAGCLYRPWVCWDRAFFHRPRLCCNDRCVDVSIDVDNCGACGIMCPFGWQCCRGICVNILFDVLHCGRCFYQCPLGTACVFGMCGYADGGGYGSQPQPLPALPLPAGLPHPPTEESTAVVE